MIHLTTKAQTKILEIIQEENDPNLSLRVFVQGGGCSGLQYGFTLDTIVDEDDHVVALSEIKIVIDFMSAQYLLGAEIDFIEDITGAHFKIKNPNAQSTCGCGNSFNATSWDI